MKPAFALFTVALAWGQSPFHLEKTIPLTGVEGRFDHFAANAARSQLFVAALGNHTLEILDIAAGRRLHTIPGMHEPQGVAYAPDLNRIYAADGGDGKLRIIDAAGFKLSGEVEIGEDADNVRYDAARKTSWVGYTSALAAFDAARGKRAGEIRLDAHAESFQLEKSGPRIFVNVPDAHEVEVADRGKMAVVAKWPVREAAANFPMALDENDHRLFIGCRRPAKVLVFDTLTGKTAASFACPGDTDDVFYDAARKRVYVVGGEGYLEAFAQKSADEYQPIGKIATAAGARTGFFAPELDRFFVAVPHRGRQQAEIRIYRVE
jgi:outer membrane protein assembly factor BamB